VEPRIIYSIYSLRDFIGKSYAELHTHHKALWKRIKEATGYTWDNQHYSIADISGHAQIDILFYERNISMYTSHGGKSLGEVKDIFSSDIFTEEAWNKFDTFIKKISEGKSYCCRCHKWVDTITSYSYAGAACAECCDDYKKEKGVSIEVAYAPDTSGT